MTAIAQQNLSSSFRINLIHYVVLLKTGNMIPLLLKNNSREHWQGRMFIATEIKDFPSAVVCVCVLHDNTWNMLSGI